MKKLYWPAGIALLLVYIFSMVIYPMGYTFLNGGWDWGYVQNIWDRWQGLNVGVLAFISSIIAFRISKYNADKQREREFTAAKAFLPHALSELCGYTKSCSVVLVEAYKIVETGTGTGRTPLTAKAPNLPADYKEIFSRCIEKADPDVGDFLSDILRKLQINHSRITELESEIGDKECYISAGNIVSYLYSLALLQAMINQLFGYARGTEEFDGSVPALARMYGVYRLWGMSIEDFGDLSGFTERVLAREPSED